MICAVICQALQGDQVDMLENYVLALGIHGYKKWSEKWVRVYRTMDPEDIQVLNEYREIFVREAEILAQGFSSGKRKVCEYCYSLYQFIESCEIQKKLKKTGAFTLKKKEEKALGKRIRPDITELLWNFWIIWWRSLERKP